MPHQKNSNPKNSNFRSAAHFYSALFFTLLFALVTFLHSPVVLAASPSISGSPPATATVGQPYTFTPRATDRDGDRLFFRIRNRPAWATFDSRTGRLYGTPVDDRSYSNIVISVSDWQFWRRVSLPPFTITVKPSGTPTPTPEPNSVPVISGAPPTQIGFGQPYSFTPSASDADGDILRFSVANKPAWASFSTSTGRLSGTPSSADIGSYGNIVVTVTDGAASKSLPAFSIAVVGNSEGTATLSWQAPTTRTDGSPLNNLAGFRVLWGTSPGSYTNNVKLANPGLSRYVVENLSPATYYFVVVAFDQKGLESKQSSMVQKVIR